MRLLQRMLLPLAPASGWIVRWTLVLTLCGISSDALFHAAAAESRGERDVDDPHMQKRPGLAGHRFVPNPLSFDAFPRTSVRIAMGVGQALDVELLPSVVLSNGDTLQGLQGDLAVALLGVGYGYAIRDWLEVSAAFELVGRLGTDVGALFEEGATVLTSFEVGWLFRLLERDRIYLSGDFSVNSSSFTGLGVGDWVEGILDGSGAPLVRKVPSLRVTTGLRLAWALNELWGVSAATHLGYGEQVSKRTDNTTTYDLVLAVDADLYRRFAVPIGFSLGGAVSNKAVDGRSDVDDVAKTTLRTAYTGRDDFLIAVDYTLSHLKPRQTLDSQGVPLSPRAIQTGSLSAVMKFYF